MTTSPACGGSSFPSASGARRSTMIWPLVMPGGWSSRQLRSTAPLPRGTWTMSPASVSVVTAR